MFTNLSVTDEMFLTHIVSTLTSLATARLHGDNLNRARLLAGAMKCLQTITKHNPPQYVLEQVLSVVKGKRRCLAGYQSVSDKSENVVVKLTIKINYSFHRWLNLLCYSREQ